MKKSWLGSALLVALAFAGCRTPGGGGVVVPPPPVFDPHGRWSAVNYDMLGAKSIYLDDSETSAFYNGWDADEDAYTTFGPFYSDPYSPIDVLGEGDTPAVLASTEAVRIRYNRFADPYNAYVNIVGTTFDRDYIRVPIGAARRATVQVYPAPGLVQENLFLESTRCKYHYSVWLTVQFNGSYDLEGYISTRFDLLNDDSGFPEDPNCDDFLAAVQYDFDTGVASLANDGFFYGMARMTTDISGSYWIPALDSHRIYTDAGVVIGFQLDTRFDAERVSSSTALTDERALAAEEIEINSGFVRYFAPSPVQFLRLFKAPRAEALEHVRAAGISGNQLPQYRDFRFENLNVQPTHGITR